MYDKIVLSPKSILKKIKEKVLTFLPAIDPLSPKNQPLRLDFSRKILRGYGITP